MEPHSAIDISACERQPRDDLTSDPIEMRSGKLEPYSPKTVQHEPLPDAPVPSVSTTPAPPSALKLHSARDVQALVPGLLAWPDGKTEVTVLSGGMSNSLYKLSHESRPPVVVRVFGQENVFSHEARRRENRLVFELAAARLAPALPAVFANGRVEQFLSARPIHARDMTAPDVYPLVAREMVRFHRFRPTASCGPVADYPAPGVLPRPIALVEQYHADSKCLYEAGKLGDFDFTRASDALDAWMRRFRSHERCMSGEGLVFAHNDLNPLNILRYDNGSVKFIDFEFAGWNFRACEIALHFAEAVGEEKRYALYPNAETLRDFCRTYLVEMNGTANVDAAEIDALVADVQLFDAFAHLLWGFWGLSRACSDEGPEFDFVEFSNGRFDACYHSHHWL